MKESRSDLTRKILLTLDHNPASIYDLVYSIENLSDSKKSRLPKLLKTMEKENLVVSALQPGPLGPYRRMYQKGPLAEEYLIETLRDGLETLLHFYNEYRKASSGQLYNLEKAPDCSAPSGNVLYLAYPKITIEDVNEMRDLITKFDINLFVSGADEIMQKTNISYSVIRSEGLELQIADKTFSEIRMRGIPSRNELPKTVSECKRVLTKEGILIIKTSFAFLDEPKKPSLAEFIRITAETLFPELGLIESTDMKQLIKSHFSKSGVYETNVGDVVFWAMK
ncbi:PadR family transcriptional regulator [Candidatus Thorarchaeota archaeon]|nr:MAG: PadR family transcriptional regulator [Candidatus Thorarchaeota archaeon]